MEKNTAGILRPIHVADECRCHAFRSGGAAVGRRQLAWIAGRTFATVRANLESPRRWLVRRSRNCISLPGSPET